MKLKIFCLCSFFPSWSGQGLISTLVVVVVVVVIVVVMRIICTPVHVFSLAMYAILR